VISLAVHIECFPLVQVVSNESAQGNGKRSAAMDDFEEAS